MDLITLGRTVGFSFAAGVNLYATVAILGLAARYGWVDLPADRDRVYALWVILRCYSRSTYAPPALSSAIVTAKCSVPFIFVEH